MNANDIDIVLYWVDGNDKAWQQKRNSYRGESVDRELTDNTVNTDTASNRYRDWDNLKYLFRGIEEYAPFVRKVFFVSDGQVPEWLNTDNEKIVMVDHKDYIPEKYLPTFSSHPIELNFHRIPGLSEHFLVVNDDFFFTSPCVASDFFVDGKPVDIMMEYPVMCSGYNPVFSNIIANCHNLVGKHFTRPEYKKRLKGKMLSPKYGSYFFYNLMMFIIPFPKYFGILTPHFTRPYLKSSFEKVWELEEAKLDETCTHKFRDRDDVNVYVFRNYNILSGNFVPGNIHKMGCAFYVKDVNDGGDSAANAIKSHKFKLICLNDDCKAEAFEECRRRINAAFEEILPNKCSFEK